MAAGNRAKNQICVQCAEKWKWSRTIFTQSWFDIPWNRFGSAKFPHQHRTEHTEAWTIPKAGQLCGTNTVEWARTTIGIDRIFARSKPPLSLKPPHKSLSSHFRFSHGFFFVLHRCIYWIKRCIRIYDAIKPAFTLIELKHYHRIINVHLVLHYFQHY